MPIPASSSAASEPKRSPKQAVPEALIYELDAGNPIYYKGYQDVLSGLKNLDDILGDSNLQAWLIALRHVATPTITANRLCYYKR